MEVGGEAVGEGGGVAGGAGVGAVGGDGLPCCKRWEALSVTV